MYLHDSPTCFRIQLRDELTGKDVLELEHAWQTAKSILEGKEFVLDLSKLSSASDDGIQLLLRMQAEGGRIVGANARLSPRFQSPTPVHPAPAGTPSQASAAWPAGIVPQTAQ